MLGERMPLTKTKTMREILREKNLLNNFLEEQASRMSDDSASDPKLSTHPLRNALDVSGLGGWCSIAPLCALA